MWDSYLACTALFHHLFRPFFATESFLTVESLHLQVFWKVLRSIKINLLSYASILKKHRISVSVLKKNERTYDENWDDVPVEANGPTLPLTPLHGQ
ncbi:hypothetical protein TNCV_2937361 [Trichonephila clavipes]|nr:hypothetical protein TNCV_2937361 [Trichonephila clavipes]